MLELLIKKTKQNKDKDDMKCAREEDEQYDQ